MTSRAIGPSVYEPIESSILYKLMNYKFFQGKKNMKLNLIFIVMDLLALLVYPLIFVNNKLQQALKSRKHLSGDLIAVGK